MGVITSEGEERSSRQGARESRRKTLRASTVLGLLALLVLPLALSGCALPGSGADAQAAPVGDVGQTLPANSVRDYNRAAALANAHNCRMAIPLYLKAVMENAMYTNAYVGLANCYQDPNVGDFGAAIREYDNAIQTDPMRFDLYIGRAGANANNGSTGAAGLDDRLALRVAKPLVPSYLSIAASFATFADFNGALDAMDRAIALAPDDPSLYEQRASYLEQAQKYTAALADYDTAIRVAPFLGLRANVNADLAQVYSDHEDYDSAIRAIDVAIKLEPNNAHYYFKSGQYKQSAANYTGALAAYQDSLRLAPQGPDAESAHEGRGDIFYALGQNKSAIAEYQQALALAGDPNTRATLRGKLKLVQPAPASHR